VNVIGIQLTNIQKEDPERYRCLSSFVVSSSAAQSAASDVKNLRVLGNHCYIILSGNGGWVVDVKVFDLC